jgi:hypothetical protein
MAKRKITAGISEALTARLRKSDLKLIHACEAANQDPDVAEIEKDFDGIRDEVPEAWK